MVVSLKCKNCGEVYKVELSAEQYQMLKSGDYLIQEILPDLDPGIRELFISGICPICWNAMFPEEDDYDWVYLSNYPSLGDRICHR